MDKIYKNYIHNINEAKMLKYDISTLQKLFNLSKSTIEDEITKVYNGTYGTKLNRSEFKIDIMPKTLYVNNDGRIYSLAYFIIKSEHLGREFRIYYEPSGDITLEV